MTQNKHTSFAAIVGFITQAIPIFWPELAPKCDQLFKLAMIYGFARAGDAPVVPAPPGPVTTGKIPILFLSGFFLLWTCTGCIARFTTTQQDERTTDPWGNPRTTITTKATAWTWGDSKSALANFKATQTEKSQGASVGSLTQESSATNFAANVGALTHLLQALKGP